MGYGIMFEIKRKWQERQSPVSQRRIGPQNFRKTQIPVTAQAELYRLLQNSDFPKNREKKEEKIVGECWNLLTKLYDNIILSYIKTSPNFK
jgi:hypothetical protein